MESDMGGSYLEPDETQEKIAKELNLAQNYDIVDMKEDTLEQKTTASVLANTKPSESEKIVSVYIVKDTETGDLYDLRDPMQFQRMTEVGETIPDTQGLKSIQHPEFWY